MTASSVLAQSCFEQTYPLTISTLSAVHLGCDEDYQPTNYVIQDLVLYGFDTADLCQWLTPAEHQALLKITSDSGPNPERLIQQVQGFILERAERICQQSGHLVTLSPSIQQVYEQRVTRAAQHESGGRRVQNKLQIERTAYDRITGYPVLPGTGLKGALRTALLNLRNQGRKRDVDAKRDARRIQTELLGGEFKTDPLRLIKFGDARWHEDPQNPRPRIQWDNNLRKNPKTQGSQSRAQGQLSLMREVIPAGCSRAFTATLNLLDIKPYQSRYQNDVPSLQFSREELIDACNGFYLRQMEAELQVLEALNCLDGAWLQWIRRLLSQELQSLFRDRHAMLLRVGRHSGAESVTIEGMRKIKIKRRNGYEELDHATTLWLAGEEKHPRNLIPYGWLLVEFHTPGGEAERASVHQQLQAYTRPLTAQTQQVLAQAAARRAEVQATLALQREQEQQRAAAAAGKAEAERLEALRLSALSAERRQIEALDQRINAGEHRNGGPQSSLSADAAKLYEMAATQNWSPDDKQALKTLWLKLREHLGIDKNNQKWKARIKNLG
jgi:CRISPR-associated protein Csm5